jgi:hypothetical protein
MSRNEASDTDYSAILNRTWDDLPDVHNLPDGSYLLGLKNVAFMPPREEGQNGKVLFYIFPKEPMEVDADAYAALGDDYDLTENQIVHTEWIEFNKDWKEKVFPLLAKFGIDVDPSQTIEETLKGVRKLRGEAIGHVTTKVFKTKDGTSKIDNIVTSFSPVV